MPPAITPVAPKTTNAPAEKLPPPEILGVNEQAKDAVAYKDGDYQQERIHEKIFQAISAFHWAAQELGGAKITPNKVKRPEISDYFKKSASTLESYTLGLGTLINDLETQKSKHNLSNTLSLLKLQHEVLKTLAQAHKEMTNPRNYIDYIFADGFIRNGKARKLTNLFLQIAKIAEPNVRQDALSHIKNGLGGIPSEKVTKALTAYQNQISSFDDFLTSPSVQALTKSLGGKARVQAQNPGVNLAA